MQVRKWISNFSKVISATPEEDRATQLSLKDGDHALKTLGLSWESKEDVLSIAIAEVSQDLPLTKRKRAEKDCCYIPSSWFCKSFSCRCEDPSPRIVDERLRLG